MRLWIILILLTSCAVGKRQVKYIEMSSEPKLTWNGQEFLIETRNSKENSALLIYKIKSTVDNENNLILLRGLQAVGKKYQTEFKVDLKDINSDKLVNYKIYWVDPDNKRTELKINKAAHN